MEYAGRSSRRRGTPEMDDRTPALPESLEIVRGAWERLSPLIIDHDAAANNRIVTLSRSNPAHAAFDMMRTKLLGLLRENKWTSVAITSPTPACGKTCIAVNLAFSLANQRDCRTVLVDLDLRRPQIGKTLAIRIQVLSKTSSKAMLDCAKPSCGMETISRLPQTDRRRTSRPNSFTAPQLPDRCERCARK